MPSIHFSSGKDDWGTPFSTFAPWHEQFTFTVDAAANGDNHLLPRWYGPGGEREDALTHDWDPTERYWCNPPYSRTLQRQFIIQAYRVMSRGGVAVLLLPARTDTKTFHEFIWDRFEAAPEKHITVHFLKGRIRFVGATHGAPFPSMIVVMDGR